MSLLKRRSKRKVIGWLVRLAFGAVLFFGLLMVAELAVRVFCPYVNYQGDSADLFDPSPGEAGVAWKPKSIGTSFGAEVVIDDNGCRVVGRGETPTTSWLILGDSVAFGVGVEAGRTFAGLLQKARAKVKVLNAAVVGMNLDGYPIVARRMLGAEPTIGRITLFLCVNDVIDSGNVQTTSSHGKGVVVGGGVLRPDNRIGIVERIIAWLRPRSKLFLLLKGTLFDGGRLFFEWDLARYKSLDEGIDERLIKIRQVARIAAESDAAFEVILLPYEYQLRVNRPEWPRKAHVGLAQTDVWLPQEKLKHYMARHAVPYRDARGWFSDPASDSKDYFLFGDPMHLSQRGHEVIFQHWPVD